MSRATRGLGVRVLLAAPESGFARARGQSLASPSAIRLRQGLSSLVEAVHAAKRVRVPELHELGVDELLKLVREQTTDLDFELMFYSDTPSSPMYFLRDLVLVGRFRAGLSAHRAPWLLVVDDQSYDGDLYDELAAEFQDIWDSARHDPWALPADEVALRVVQSRSRPDALEVIRTTCQRFQLAATELADDLPLADERTVARLLTAALRLQFETVLVEESTPSHAGRGGRIDLVLPDERIAIEVKFVREGRTPQQVSDELILAQTRYSSHPNCSLLVCFVYDPHHLFQNRRAVARDLESKGGVALHLVFAP
jgi:hypothetical protein